MQLLNRIGPKTYSAFAGLGLVLLIGGGAQAAPITFTDPVTVTDVQITGYDYTVGIQNPTTGQYEYAYDTAIIFTIDGHQVLVDCDDLWHNIGIGPQTLTFTIQPFSSASTVPNPSGGTYSQPQIAEMSWLQQESDLIWNGHPAPITTIPDGDPITVEEQLAALQLASWEIGNPTTVYTPSSMDVSDLAASYVANVTGAGFNGPLPGSVVEQFVSNTGVQAQLFDPILSPMPEPASWTMMFLGLFGLGFLYAGRRRRTNGAATL